MTDPRSNESVVNLTKPALYGLYDEDINKAEDSEIYNNLQHDISMKPKDSAPQHHTISVRQIIVGLVVLGLAGVGYFELSKHIHDNHVLHPNLASKPLMLGVELSKALTNDTLPVWTYNALEGIIFGLVQPIFDYLVFGVPTSARPFSGATTILRSSVAMLGVAFGLRKIEWASSLQASIAWLFLNIVLWLFFDGSLSALLTSTVVGLTSSFSSFYVGGDAILDFANEDSVALFLYYINFYFLGLLIFGKLGRYMFH